MPGSVIFIFPRKCSQFLTLDQSDGSPRSSLLALKPGEISLSYYTPTWLLVENTKFTNLYWLNVELLTEHWWLFRLSAIRWIFSNYVNRSAKREMSSFQLRRIFAESLNVLLVQHSCNILYLNQNGFFCSSSQKTYISFECKCIMII